VTQADSDLISRTASGDAAAFRELIHRHSGRVQGIAYQLTGDAEEARDVAQEIFLRIYQSLDSYNQRKPFEAWLYRLTVNLAIDYRRRRLRRPAQADAALVDQAVDPQPGADQGVEGAELLGVVQRLLGRLSSHQKKVLVLRDLQNFSTDEVAAIVGCRPATVRVHLSRARRRIAELLEADHPQLVADHLPRRSAP
jgi:RNA polymerase sigma-70 factor, ECF subfamily